MRTDVTHGSKWLQSMACQVQAWRHEVVPGARLATGLDMYPAELLIVPSRESYLEVAESQRQVAGCMRTTKGPNELCISLTDSRRQASTGTHQVPAGT